MPKNKKVVSDKFPIKRDPKVQKKSKKKKQMKRSKKYVMPQQALISACAAKYAAVLFDPWCEAAVGACVPAYNFRPTQKAHAKIVFTVTIGTGGSGFAMISPCVANDVPTIWYTATTAYAGTTSTNLVTNGVQVSNISASTLPYTSANLVNPELPGQRSNAEARIVGCGLKWRYTGKEVDRGGSFVSYVDPSHQTVENQTSNTLMALNQAVIGQPNANHSLGGSMSIFATNALEQAFPEATTTTDPTTATLAYLYPYSDGVGTLVNDAYGAPVAAVVFNGTSGTSYLCEYIVHVEYIGKVTQTFATPNSADAEGTMLVQSAASSAQTKQASNNGGSMRSYAKASMQEAKREMIDMGHKVAIDAFASILSEGLSAGLKMV